MHHLSDKPYLGISSSLFPTTELLIDEFGLMDRHGITVVEIGYEQTGPALMERNRYEQLILLKEMDTTPLWSLHAPYRPERDIPLLDDDQRQRAVQHTIRAFDLAHDLGISLMVMHCSQTPIGSGERLNRCKQAHRSLSTLVSEARRRQVRLAVEFLPPEWLGAGLEESFRLVEDLDPEWIGFCLDTNHANLTGDLAEMVHALGPRLWSLHISDNDGRKQQHWMPFQGVIDWPDFMQSLARIQYTGPLVYELDPFAEGPAFALNAIKKNFDLLMGFWTGK